LAVERLAADVIGRQIVALYRQLLATDNLSCGRRVHP